jgi:hypothetical protein
MKFTTITKFEKLKNRNGVYVFNTSDGCTICKNFIEELKKYNTDDWTIVELGPHELNPTKLNWNLKGFPTTKFFVDDKVVWDKPGALFALQMRHLNKVMQEYKKEECMVIFKKGTIPDFEYQHALKRPVPVKCYQMDKNFQVQTIEGMMNGKSGDWLMIGVNGEMYPCDADEFGRTFDLVDLS